MKKCPDGCPGKSNREVVAIVPATGGIGISASKGEEIRRANQSLCDQSITTRFGHKEACV